jgi:hypothetical protein
MIRSSLLVLALILSVVACGEDAPAPALVEVDSDAGATTLDADQIFEPDPIPSARTVRRQTVEQIARSIPVVTGGLSWVEDYGQGPMDMLTFLSGSLGAPDYMLVTHESLEPSMILAKFMTDASHRICSDWIKRDENLPAGERTLITHEDWDSLDEADVRQSLAALNLRFFSVYTPPDDGAATDALYAVFEHASTSAPQIKAADDGWFAVCIAMMTDPRFVLY